jgi:hypothetical protein
MHRGPTVHGHDLSGQPGNRRQVRRRYLQHQSALLPQFGNLLPGGLGILLPLSGVYDAEVDHNRDGGYRGVARARLRRIAGAR